MIVFTGFLILLITSLRLILIGSGFSVTSIIALEATDDQLTSLASLPREMPRSSSLKMIFLRLQDLQCITNFTALAIVVVYMSLYKLQNKIKSAVYFLSRDHLRL